MPPSSRWRMRRRPNGTWRHTTWFLETFILRDFLSGYTLHDDRFPFLFNSYYEAEGERHSRARRGMITRPSLEEVLAYRAHVDGAIAAALPDLPAAALELLALGCHHEEQHQELLVTDVLHLMAQNPLEPAIWPAARKVPVAMPGPARLDDGQDGDRRDRPWWRRLLLRLRRAAPRSLAHPARPCRSHRHQWRMGRVHRRWRLCRSTALAVGRLGLGEGERHCRPAVLGTAGGRVDAFRPGRSPPDRSRRARHAYQLLRG